MKVSAFDTVKSWNWVFKEARESFRKERAGNGESRNVLARVHAASLATREQPASTRLGALARPGPPAPAPGPAAAPTLSMILFTTSGFFRMCWPAPVLNRTPGEETAVLPWAAAIRRHPASPGSGARAAPASAPRIPSARSTLTAGAALPALRPLPGPRLGHGGSSARLPSGLLRPVRLVSPRPRSARHGPARLAPAPRPTCRAAQQLASGPARGRRAGQRPLAGWRTARALHPPGIGGSVPAFRAWERPWGLGDRGLQGRRMSAGPQKLSKVYK